MNRRFGLGAATLVVALVAGAAAAPPGALDSRHAVSNPRDRSGGAVSLAEFRQLQAEVQGLKQQVARLEQRLDALGGHGGGNTGGGARGGPGNLPGCPQCP